MTTIKAAAVLVAILVAAVPMPAAAGGGGSTVAQVAAQASTGKLGREVAFLVCVNPDQVDVAVSALFLHELPSLLTHGFVMPAESRTSVNLNAVPYMPAVGNFSIAIWTEASDEDTSSTTCEVVYYSGSPLREVAREPLTVRKFVKRG